MRRRRRYEGAKCSYAAGGEYYRLHFAVVGYYMKYGDTYIPMVGSVRMKERSERR